MREHDSHSLSLPPMRTRRGRSFIERLRQVARPADADAEESGVLAAPEATGDAAAEGQPYNFLEGHRRGAAEPHPALDPEGVDGEHDADVELRSPASYPELALEVFNSSEFPRRIAGVARSLGTPVVSVRSAEHLASVVQIVVAWELSWYRYEVDLSEEPVQARVLAQGTELSELAREERAGNALVADTGALSLAPA
ncbi:MAG: hypothetical protein QOE10_1287 [Gaiellales bacterium]|nr:hypothetical protein [Gaiellales bacterium]